MSDDNQNQPGWQNKRPVRVDKSKIDQRARVAMKPEEFDRLIKQQGVRVRVYRTLFCPRVKSIDGAEHDIACPLCKGNGWLDVRPLDTFAFVASQSLEKRSEAEGFIDGNTVSATFVMGISLQYFTRVEFPDHTDTFMERVKRSQGNKDVLKYSARQIDIVIDENGKEYFQGNDFNLSPDGDIIWIQGRGPLARTVYSIFYTITLQFRAIKALHNNRFAQVADKNQLVMTKLQEQWQLEKIYLADRRDSNNQPIAPNKIRDPDED